jgi:predicted acyl esterase
VTFSKPTEITGSSKLHLRFSVSEGNNDADVFVALQKLDRSGNTVHFPYHTFINDGHVAYGWLRASKRALAAHSLGDEVAYTGLEKDVSLLLPNEPVDLDINIQPSATMFRKGETLKVVVQGHDFGEYAPDSQIPRAGTGCNKQGTHIAYLSESYLEVPVIPMEP